MALKDPNDPIIPRRPEPAVVWSTPVPGDGTAMREALEYMEWEAYIMDTEGVRPNLEADALDIPGGLRMPLALLDH